MAAPPGYSETELIAEANVGLNLLLNDELPAAKELLASKPESCWHLVGSGLISFMVSALGVEDKELHIALETLIKAESAATKGKHHAEADVAGHWWPRGTQYDVLVADTVIAQALVHILTESYLEFLKAVYKLNRAYKLFSHTFKVVFPHGVKETEMVDDIVNGINATHMAAKIGPVNHRSEKSGWSFGSRRKAQSLENRSSSHADLRDSLRTSKSTDVTTSSMAATAPVTPREATTPTEELDTGDEMASMVDDRLSLSHVRPNWVNDNVVQLTVGGAAFGHGLFELVFALLPPKLRKLTSFFGYSYGNRTVALKLLSVAAMGSDTHAGLVLLMSGWQANRSIIIKQCKQVLSHVKQRLPNGTLWLLNDAKVERMSGDPAKAAEILTSTIDRGSDFKQAEAVLVFELAWCQTSQCQYREAARSFLQMRELNQWSHATYTIIAAGCLLHETNKDDKLRKQLDDLITVQLPGMLGKKRLMGQPPPSEAFVSARLEFWSKKRDRWIGQMRAAHGDQLRPYEVIRIPPIDELALQWQTFAHMPPRAAEQLIAYLTGLTPAPLPQKEGLMATNGSTSLDLDCADELTLRAVLLGVLYRRCGDYSTAAAYLEVVISRGTGPLDDGHSYLVPVAHFESAVLECLWAERESHGSQDPSEAHQTWQRRLKAAEKHLDEVFKQGTFLMQSRTESRAQMLRTEILAWVLRSSINATFSKINRKRESLSK